MKTILYVGLDAPARDDAHIIHCPLIEIVAIDSLHLLPLDSITHVIVTSKSAIPYLQPLPIWHKSFISVGQATTRALQLAGATKISTAQNECQEGIIELIDRLAPHLPSFFWGHSSLSRPHIANYLQQKGYPLINSILYETRFKEPTLSLPLTSIDEIHFSSSSTVDAFFHFFGPPPKNILLHTQGAITQKCLEQHLLSCYP